MVSDLGSAKKQKYEIPTICTRPYYANKAHISGNDGNLSLSVPIVPLAILMALTMLRPLQNILQHTFPGHAQVIVLLVLID